MHPDDAVVVGVYANAVEADLAASWLEADGIVPIVLSDDAGGAYPMLQAARGVKLLVAPENAARAREILAASGD